VAQFLVDDCVEAEAGSSAAPVFRDHAGSYQTETARLAVHLAVDATIRRPSAQMRHHCALDEPTHSMAKCAMYSDEDGAIKSQ
jgi:hypothetical protein